MRLFTPNARSLYEAMVWEYEDRIVANCTCNKCGEKFVMELRASPVAMREMSRGQKVGRVFAMAGKRHSCDEDSFRQDPAETNRIVNKWHEYKLKTKKLFGQA